MLWKVPFIHGRECNGCFPLSATEPPDTPFILPIYFSDISERWIIVKWQATSDVKSPLRFFTLQLNKNGEGWQVYSPNVPHSSRSLKVEGLIPGETYTFRIMATNDRGNSPYSVASTAVSTRLAREFELIISTVLSNISNMLVSA